MSHYCIEYSFARVTKAKGDQVLKYTSKSQPWLRTMGVSANQGHRISWEAGLGDQTCVYFCDPSPVMGSDPQP